MPVKTGSITAVTFVALSLPIVIAAAIAVAVVAGPSPSPSITLSSPIFHAGDSSTAFFIVSPVEGTVRSGETFRVKIVAIPDEHEPIKSVKLELHFDPSLFYIVEVGEGELFTPKASFAYVVEYNKVTITGLFSDERGVTSRGVFAYITMGANSTNFGTSILELSDVELKGVENEDLPFFTVDGRIKVIPTSFITAPGGYPSIPGVHTGTITPSVTISGISRLYTYPCPGTGGHTEEITLWNSSWCITAKWTGYGGNDWHVVEFPYPFSLIAGHTYHYYIRTGSYPRIIHRHTFTNRYGTINCTSFRDADGNLYARSDWIPAIKLYSVSTGSEYRMT